MNNNNRVHLIENYSVDVSLPLSVIRDHVQRPDHAREPVRGQACQKLNTDPNKRFGNRDLFF